MNILIVGGAGYVGGGIVDNLKNKHNVTVYDSLIYEESYRKDVNFIYGDIREQDKLLPLFDQNDAVIWLAALVGDGACSINPDLTFEINSESVKFLAQNFKKRIIFLSTCSVYGAQDGLLDEESSINPLSEYASSKIQAEEYLKDTNSVIFRLGTLFGISDEFSRIRLDLVVNILVTKALTDEKLTVFGGEQWRPLLHVNDVANAIENVLEKDIKGVYNLHHKNYKIIDIAEAIVEKIPSAKIETIWLRKLLTSFKESGEFHEQCIENIFSKLSKKYPNHDLEVCGRFLRRGGIDINPIRSSKKSLFFKNFRAFNQ